ncbi:MAG TPA: hypothetical protein VIR38_11445 [Thalassobaculum sp.]
MNIKIGATTPAAPPPRGRPGDDWFREEPTMTTLAVPGIRMNLAASLVAAVAAVE